jgi:hypothetical protein
MVLNLLHKQFLLHNFMTLSPRKPTTGIREEKASSTLDRFLLKKDATMFLSIS